MRLISSVSGRPSRSRVLGLIGWRLVTFGRLMHRIIEAVARQTKLMPAEPVGIAALPIGPPRTV